MEDGRAFQLPVMQDLRRCSRVATPCCDQAATRRIPARKLNMTRFVLALSCWCFCLSALSLGADEARIDLDAETRQRCESILRAAFKSDEFWPAMHAAEALTQAGHGAEVRAHLPSLLTTEKDDQRRCGLARELVRAGDLARTRLMLEILASSNPHGHTHACESLYKVWQIGDGKLLNQSLRKTDKPKEMLMAAAALARWGHADALSLIRKFVTHDDGEIAKISAWILARIGDLPTDGPGLRAGAKKFNEPLTKAYFEHALAALGDAEGQAVLIKNLDHADSAVRIYAGEFAVDARVVAAKNALIRHLNDEVLDARVRAAQALLVLASPPPLGRREVIVNDVFPATRGNPRYSEGSIIPLNDGRLLYATTEFIGQESDFAKARIVAVESRDSGRTWSERRVLQENVGAMNVMSVSFLRLKLDALFDGPIGFFYLVKNGHSDLSVWFRRSNDEGATWSEPVKVTTQPGYHVMNNDRVVVLPNGRLIVPVASTADVGKVNKFVCQTYASDDQGQSWKLSENSVPYDKRGAMEPEVLALDDNNLLMHFRTQLGHLGVSRSTDGGRHWSEGKAWTVAGPESPATLRRIPSTGHWALIWNDTFVPGAGHGGKRTPLTVAISKDDGATWSQKRHLETSTQHTFAYTSLVFHEGRAVMSYYVRDEKTGQISSRFRSVPIGTLAVE